MTYSSLSPLMGLGAAGASVIQAWFTSHNAHAPANLGVLITAQASLGGYNGDLMAAQIAEETGFWTSYAAVTLHNPAGIGITTGLPISEWPSFPSDADGIHAMLAHLLTYVDGAANPYRSDDPRYNATVTSDMFGKAKILQDLEQHWAYTDPAEYAITPAQERYAYKIGVLANELVSTVGGVTVATPAVPTQADIGFPTRAHWAADTGPSRRLADIKWFIVHDTEGQQPGDEQVLTSAADPVESTTAQIQRDGQLIMEVPLTSTAWTPGNDAVAEVSINVELDKLTSQDYTEEQYQSLAAFFRWCVKEGMTNVPPAYVGRTGANGIIGHQDVPNPNVAGSWGGVSGHTDPGPQFDWMKLVRYITGGGTTPASNDPNSWQDTVTGFYVVNLSSADKVPMLDFFNKEGGAFKLGHPKEGMHQDDDGVYRQLCENVLLECWPHGFGNMPGPYCRFGGLGLRYLALKQKGA